MAHTSLNTENGLVWNSLLTNHMSDKEAIVMTPLKQGEVGTGSNTDSILGLAQI